MSTSRRFFQFFSVGFPLPLGSQILLWLATFRMRIFLFFTQGVIPGWYRTAVAGFRTKIRCNFARKYPNLENVGPKSSQIEVNLVESAPYHVASAGTCLKH